MKNFQLIMALLGVVGPMIADNKITIGEVVEAVLQFVQDNGYYDKTIYELK